ncbi:SLAM family member 7 isoform X2 [Piliocolobus tephrosceles]|uniref:SLAM family member 7 n=1 Tax=Piliocolobus tephrosceles TaxID=591936 RepID=A0A8C9HRA5_9PRIM|nr:SLAM family member 7 isoform X2 [Piliocolobus tephrosceles]
MAGSPTCFILIYILWQLTGSTASGSVKELVGSIDGAVTFPLKSKVKQVDSIVWTFNTTPLVTLQPEGGPMIVTQNRNKERVDFPDGGYSLKLSKLKKNDSGIYNVEIYSSSLQDPFTRKYVLRVYEHLSKPKVTVGLQSNKNGTCVTNLTCCMEHGEEDVIYTWKALGRVVNESHNGSILPISWRWGESDMTFICIAKNPVSSNFSSPILARKLCEGAADDSDSSMVFLCLLLVPLLLSLFVLGLFLWFMKRKTQESIEEKKRADICRETPNICPYSGENTEYDTIPSTNRTIPTEDAANTLYSTVEIPKKMENPHSLLTMPDTPRLFAYENVI